MSTIETIHESQKEQFPKRIEAVVVSVDYADFLRWTLPFNRQQFDRIVVVTSPADRETQELCEFWHVECVATDVFYKDGDEFNKGRAINEGLRRLNLSDWVVHLDADIFLLPRTREILEMLPLCPKTLYSIDRLNCRSFELWFDFLERPERMHGADGLLRLSRFDVGSRLLHLGRDGWLPIGYFQMWNALETGVFHYPERHGAADRTDTLFAQRFERRRRSLIPELACVHLESENCEMGANWNGRTTQRFGLPPL